MTEGWFLRSDTGEFFSIHEHRNWIEQPENARTVGVPESVIAQFPEWRDRDRGDFLRWAFRRSPNLVRVRNHGIYTTFETFRVTKKTLESIHGMCRKIGVGDCLLVVINELRPNGRHYQEFWSIFDDKIKRGKPLVPLENQEL